jgi:ankyrin repeat protein
MKRTFALLLVLLIGAPLAAAKPTAKGDALFEAAEKGRIAEVQKFLAGGGSPNAADKSSLTLLNWAAYGGSLEIVKLLIGKHAEINPHANKAGWTPLMNASATGYPQVVAYLLDHGADLNALSAEGYSALSFAAVEQRTDVVRLLLAHGADGGNALVQMVVKKEAAAVGLLLASGVDANATPRTKEKWFNPGETALYAAASANAPEIVSLLLDKGANPEIARPDGGNMSTPLMMGAYFCNGPMIDALLSHGASRSTTNSSGETAAHLAETGWTNDMKPCAPEITAKLQ